MEVSDGEETILHDRFSEYDEAGNITKDTISDFHGDTSTFHAFQYSYNYNEDGSIAKKTSTDDDGDVTITEYTYDEHSNLLTEHTYEGGEIDSPNSTNTFSFYIYEKFQLKNGVYVATGERTSNSIPELPPLMWGDVCLYIHNH